MCFIGGGFTIAPLKHSAFGETRARVQQLVQIDLNGWGANYLPFCHQHTVLHMLNSVAGMVSVLIISVSVFIYCLFSLLRPVLLSGLMLSCLSFGFPSVAPSMSCQLQLVIWSFLYFTEGSLYVVLCLRLAVENVHMRSSILFQSERYPEMLSFQYRVERAF